MDKDREHHQLAPVGARWKWNTVGLLLQAIGAAVPAGIVAEQAKRDGTLDSLTRVTVRLVWHEVLQNHRYVELMIAGVLAFVLGAIVLARPYVHGYGTWLIAVPVAALAGVVLLGVLAVIIAAIVVAITDLSGGGGGGGGGGGSLLDGVDVGPDWGGRRRRRREQEQRDLVRLRG